MQAHTSAPAVVPIDGSLGATDRDQRALGSSRLLCALTRKQPRCTAVLWAAGPPPFKAAFAKHGASAIPLHGLLSLLQHKPRSSENPIVQRASVTAAGHPIAGGTVPTVPGRCGSTISSDRGGASVAVTSVSEAIVR